MEGFVTIVICVLEINSPLDYLTYEQEYIEMFQEAAGILLKAYHTGTRQICLQIPAPGTCGTLFMMFNFLGLQFSNLKNEGWVGNNTCPAHLREWLQAKGSTLNYFGNKAIQYIIIIIIFELSLYYYYEPNDNLKCLPSTPTQSKISKPVSTEGKKHTVTRNYWFSSSS